MGRGDAKPLKYFKESLENKELQKITKRELKSKVEEHVYGHKFNQLQNEKHHVIMSLIQENNKKKFEQTKKSQQVQKKKIEIQRKQIEEQNRLKMLEVKMRTKISALSLQQRKQKILENHWRIGDLTPGLEQSRALKQQRMYLRNRVYTPNTELKYKDALKHFYETNEFGLDQNQLGFLEQRRSVGDEWKELRQTELGNGSLLLVKEKNLKVHKEEVSQKSHR